MLKVLEKCLKYLKDLLERLGLQEAKGVDTPGVHESRNDDEQLQEPLPEHQVTMFRACAARCNFLSLDRPDIQFSAKEVSRGMARPTEGDLLRLKRLVRYLKNTQGLFLHTSGRNQ